MNAAALARSTNRTFDPTTNRASLHGLRLAGMLIVCTILYYLPYLANAAGMTAAADLSLKLHDLFSLLFFAPVVYAAYVFGVGQVVLVTLVAMLSIFPYSIFLAPAYSYGIVVSSFAGNLYAPAALGLVLCAVGSAVALVQRSDTQRQARIREVRCMYEVGRAAEECSDVSTFLARSVRLIRQSSRRPERAQVRLVARGLQSETDAEVRSDSVVSIALIAGGESIGILSIDEAERDSAYRHPHTYLQALADRLAGAIRKIELEQRMKDHSTMLEEAVAGRTKQLQDAQEKLVRSERLAAVGELASGVGHELRNPLNVIRNCVYLIDLSLGEKADEDTRNTLKLLDRQVDISNRIVTDLLDFTRVRPPTLCPIDLNSLVRESLSWVVIPEGINVVTRYGEASPIVMVDAEQLGRVLVNVVANGLQAISGTGSITVSTASDAAKAWVKIEDTGCGIAPENIRKIFEPLFTTKKKGIGLGLAIARRLVEQNGGEIAVESVVSRGSQFTVTLPRTKGEGNA